jgi:hypothetical protein
MVNQNSISLIILKQLANDFRHNYPQFDIKAHPVNDTSAVLVVKNNYRKFTFNLFAGNLDKVFALTQILSIMRVKQWVIKHNIFQKVTDNNTSKYILLVDIVANGFSESQHPLPIGVDLAEQDSIRTIHNWICDTIQLPCDET